jgi:hypothetical protein
MRGDAIYRIVGGMVLIVFAITVAVIKFTGSPDIMGAVSDQVKLVIGCLAIAGLGAAVTVAGFRHLGKIRRMTELIVASVREENRVITREIAESVGLHETDIRERVDEMIKTREIPAGTRITYVGGEKVVK